MTLEELHIVDSLIAKLADAVFEAAEYFNARDEMNNIESQNPRMKSSALAKMMNEAVSTWRDWKFGDSTNV
jgi:hypothetical protein